MRIILGSASPRRREILGSLGLRFEVLPPDIDEICDTHSPEEYVFKVSADKSRAVYLQNGKPQDALIVTADTAVAIDDVILGKPESKESARRMLRMLSGKIHRVVTGVTVRLGDEMITECERTDVSFLPLSDDEIERYISTDEPYDKAGGYAVQGMAKSFISELRGDYNNVVGFPDKLFLKMAHTLLGYDLINKTE